ncbi:MAG: ATP-binding protein [Chloroflexota bacterium]|nr:ATP-binding protein [Chloroflexota bacterium]
MKKLDKILSGTNSTPPGNGKISSKVEPESELELPLQVICHDPQNKDEPCPLCGGKGVYALDVPLDDPRFGKFQRCPNNPVQEDQWLQERLRRYGNLKAYKGKTFESFQTDLSGSSYSQNVVTSLEKAKRAAQLFADNPNGWIVFEGRFGCGKTHLAVAIANWRLEKYGERVLFITAPDLLDVLRSTFDPNSQSTFDDYFDEIRKSYLLVLDDLGVENRSDWAKEKLFQLLNHRHVEALPTVFTSNIAADDLDPHLSSRIMERDFVTHVKIQAPDFRRASRKAARDSDIFNMHLYQHMRFETFSTDSGFADEVDNLKNALQMAVEWSENPERWLFIMGEYGSGKTHLAAAIAYDLHERGHDVMFRTVPDLLDFLRLSFNPRSDARFDKRFHEIVNVPFLVLDDLRLASATPWAKEKLFQIIDYRYLSRMPTVITSSETIEETDERLATRLLDRRVCRPFALRARSYVKRMKNRR